MAQTIHLDNYISITNRKLSINVQLIINLHSSSMQHYIFINTLCAITFTWWKILHIH